MTKFEQRGRVRRPFPAQVDMTKLAKCRHVIERILARLISKIEPVGDQIHPQHALQPNRRPTVTGLRIMRLDQRFELTPRDQCIHAGEKLALARSPAMQIERLCRCEGHLFHARAPDLYLRFRPICRELVQSFPNPKVSTYSVITEWSERLLAMPTSTRG